MAEFNLPTAHSGMSTEQLVEMISKMQKELDWLLNNIDSKNVTELNTNVTNVRSADGSTTIDGNTLVMTDTNQVRLELGYDKVNDIFKFILYNKSGASTFEVDSNGNVLIKGDGRIDVGTDANIGNNINLGDQSAINETKSINFSGEAVISTDQGDLVIFSGNSTGDLRISSARNMFIENYQGYTRMAGEELDIRHDRISFYNGSPVSIQDISRSSPDLAKDILSALDRLNLVNSIA